MHPRIIRIGCLIAVTALASACSNARDAVSVLEAIGRVAPVIASAAPAVASAAPVIADSIEKLKPSPTPTPPPQGVTSSIERISMRVGEFRDLLASLRRLDGVAPAAGEVEWRVENPAVVFMEVASGRARAASPGETIVTAALKGHSDVVAQIAVEVADKALVEKILILPEKLGLEVGESEQLTASVHMVDGQINGNVLWASSDSTIAVVNNTTGEVTALRSGRVTIIAAYAADARYKGLAEITVVSR